ncbi:alpha/beta hydrolase [Nocardioides sp.]|uniref:alpha/beta hydrolase n=1 Tax=Nocardioides sp. TaxID=35761 RepID=UPI0035297B15
MRRWVVGLVVLGLVAVSVGVVGTILVVRGVVGDLLVPAARPGLTSSPGAETTVAPSPALQRFYSQSLDWAACPDESGDDCATLEVPLDYADPAGETIRLALLRHPAAVPRDRLGSLVVNPGGPGAPGTSYAAGAGSYFGRELVDRFDLVGFDPRGAGDSSPVDCLTDAQLDDYVAEDPDPDTTPEIRAFMRSVREFGAGCATHSPAVAAHISTVEAARDMDVLRAALGESTMVYFGASYGTKLGATYADLFPDRVGRMVLDGALDPTLDTEALSLGQARGFQTALDAYLANCVDSSDSCFLGDSVDAGRQTISDLLASIERQPLPGADGRELEIGNAFYGIVLPLYNRSSWFALSTALKAALDGDGSQLLAFSDLYTSRAADGTYDDNSLEANLAINCLDDPSSYSPRQIEGLFGEFEQASPTFGRVFAWGLAACRDYPFQAEDPLTGPLHAAGAAPILVIGTTRDPATPYAWAQALASQLDSGVLVTRDGDGHVGYRRGNDCVDAAVEDYLVTGAVPEDGLTC